MSEPPVVVLENLAESRLTFHSSSQGAVRWRGPEGPQNP